MRRALLLVVSVLVLTAEAQFTPITILPMATRAGGSYNFGPVTVPTGVRGASALMDVSQATDPLPDLTTILEGSLDGGSTWMSAGAFTRTPAPKGTNRLGQPVTSLGTTVAGGPFWEATTNANRRLRGIANLGGSMRFALVVTPK
jgi:hypothetical protein